MSGIFSEFCNIARPGKKYLYTYILAESPGKIEQDKIPTFHKLKLMKNVGHIVFWGEKQCCNKVIMLPSQPFYCLATDIRKGLFHPVFFLSQSRTKQTNKQTNKQSKEIYKRFVFISTTKLSLLPLFSSSFYFALPRRNRGSFLLSRPTTKHLLPSFSDSHKPPGFSLFL